MNVPSDDSQSLGFWDQIKIRLEPVGVSFLILGVGVLLGAAFAPIDTDLRTTLLGISLALFSVGLGLVAVGISVKSDLRYTEILSRIETNLTKVLEYFEPSVDEIEFPSDLRKNVVIKPPVATAYADVAGSVEVTTAKPSEAQAQARLDADKKKVGYTRGEVYEKKDGSWGIHWGGKYPL
jgi:hypothetical protein